MANEVLHFPERIVRHEVDKDGVTWYAIKWHGVPDSKNTWQFDTDLYLAKKMLNDYQRKNGLPITDPPAPSTPQKLSINASRKDTTGTPKSRGTPKNTPKKVATPKTPKTPRTPKANTPATPKSKTTPASNGRKSIGTISSARKSVTISTPPSTSVSRKRTHSPNVTSPLAVNNTRFLQGNSGFPYLQTQTFDRDDEDEDNEIDNEEEEEDHSEAQGPVKKARVEPEPSAFTRAINYVISFWK